MVLFLILIVKLFGDFILPKIYNNDLKYKIGYDANYYSYGAFTISSKESDLQKRYFQISAYIKNNNHPLVSNYSSLVLCITKNGLELDAKLKSEESWIKLWQIAADNIYHSLDTAE